VSFAAMTDFAALRQRLVENQIRPSEVTDRELVKAILAVPRELFVEPAERPFAYSDRELRISSAAPDRRMIDPVQLARLIQALPLDAAAKVMVIGCGSGYSAALLSRLAARVVAVEENPALAAAARENLPAVGAQNVLVVESRLTEGFPPEAPYDAILIDGAVEVVPDALIRQLRPEGALAVIEREERISRAMLYERIGDGATRWPQFEAWATALPGFERPREFVF
jgi:protein-L-isoaspartate(D-aspartate) O-methyltransferase